MMHSLAWLLASGSEDLIQLLHLQDIQRGLSYRKLLCSYNPVIATRQDWGKGGAPDVISTIE